MSRRDLTELEIREARILGRHLDSGKIEPGGAKRLAAFVERLAGEVIELREREGWQRQLHDLEGEY
jgi:hypothetical protein